MRNSQPPGPLVAILAAAFRYGAKRGALDQALGQPWRDSVPLAHASLKAVIKDGAPSLHGILRLHIRLLHGAAIQAEVDRAYRLARYLYVTRPRQETVIRLVRRPAAPKLWTRA